MTSCIISECINTLPAMTLFKLLDKCSIFIQNTNITHNTLLSGHGFLLAEVQEKVVISDCLYKNNSAPGHFVVTGNSTLFISQSQFLYNNITKTQSKDKKGLVSTDHTNVNIANCLFMRNMIGNEDTKMILIKRGKLNVEESVVDFSFAQDGILGNGLTAVTVDSCQKVNFTNTTFNETVLPIAMEVISNERISRNFVLINNCSFLFTMGTTIQAVNITDIIIYNSFLELLSLVWSPFNPIGINVLTLKP